MSLINIFQAANANVDNQQVKDNLQRQQIIKVLVQDVQTKEQEAKQIQENQAKIIQGIAQASKG